MGFCLIVSGYVREQSGGLLVVDIISMARLFFFFLQNAPSVAGY